MILIYYRYEYILSIYDTNIYLYSFVSTNRTSYLKVLLNQFVIGLTMSGNVPPTCPA